MKVLIADKFEQVGIAQLNQLGVEVDYQPDLKDDSLTQTIRTTRANILIVRSTKVTKEMMLNNELSLIIRAGAGYNTIDIDSATDNNIHVANCPGKNSIAVAELTLGLILAIDRRIPDNVNSLRNGIWNKKEFSKANGVFGKTLGIIGFGSIGQEVVARAKAFGMNILVYSQWLTDSEVRKIGVTRSLSLQELANSSDIVSVHVSLRAETRKLITSAFFESMKPGAYFINTSRAEVVDQPALENACQNKKVFAGLDVFDEEPSSAQGSYQGGLKDLDQVYCTHHIGASTEQAQLAIASEVVQIVENYINQGIVRNRISIDPVKI
jgi:D-3-phosphoglycerate dehydrogenase